MHAPYLTFSFVFVFCSLPTSSTDAGGEGAVTAKLPALSPDRKPLASPASQAGISIDGASRENWKENRKMCGGSAPETRLAPASARLSVAGCGSYAARRFTRHALQLAHLVAQQGRLLEFQIVCRAQHLLLQFTNSFRYVEVPARFIQDRVRLRRLIFACAQAFLDRPAHAARRDVVLLVVGDLLLPPILRHREELL